MHVRKSIFSLLTLFCLTLQTQAINFVSTNQFEVTTNNTLTSEHWILANDIVMDGTMPNDLFMVAGNLIDLVGSYEGNIWGLANTVSLQGYGERNARLVGNLVQVNGIIDENLMAAANTIKITEDTHIKGDIALFGIMSSIIEGTIDGDLKATGQTVSLDAGVGGDAHITANEIQLLKNTRVMGDLYYTSPKELVVPEGMVFGELKRVIVPPEKINWFAALNGFFGALLLALPFTSLFPVTIAISTQAIRTSTLRCLSVGALISILLPIMGISLVMSSTTLPSGLIILSIWGILGYMGKILSAMVLGYLILRIKQPTLWTTVLAIAIGLAIIYLAIAIPYTRTAAYLTSSWLGMGALIVSAFRKRKMIIQLPKNLKDLETLQNQPTNKEEK